MNKFRIGQLVEVIADYGGLCKGARGFIRIALSDNSLGIEVIEPLNWGGHALDGSIEGLKTGWWVSGNFLKIISGPYSWRKL